jgi:integrase-like protein
VVNRQKPSGIASKESILKTHLVPELGTRKLYAIRNEDVQRLKNRLRDKAPKIVNNVLRDPECSPEELLTVLREYRHLRGPRVLCKDDGAPLSRQSAWTRVRRAVKLAGVPTGVHILRHTFCSHLAMQGAPSIAIQELAGHQEMSVAQRYMHLSPDVLASSIQLLESRPKRGERGDIVETAPAQNGSGGRSISQVAGCSGRFPQLAHSSRVR